MLNSKIQYFERLIQNPKVSEKKISNVRSDNIRKVNNNNNKNNPNNHNSQSSSSQIKKWNTKKQKVTNRIITPIAKVSVDQNPEDELDEFGLRDFSQNSNDNYIVEATNKDGIELRFTFFGMMSRYVSIDQDVGKVFDNLICEFNEKLSDNTYSNLTELRLKNEFTSYKDTRQYSQKFSNNNSTKLRVEDEFTNYKNTAKYETESEDDTDDVVYDAVYISDEKNTEIVATTQNQNEKHYKNQKSNSRLYEEEEEVDYWEVLYTEGVKQNPQIVKPPPINMATHPSKIPFIIEEMIRTEKTYLGHLLKLLEYQSFLETLTHETHYIFGNLNAIYDHTKSLLSSLENKTTAEGVADVFINHEKGFALYPEFARNEAQAKIYLEKFEEPLKVKQKELGEPLGLANWLWTPLQRLGRYILLFQGLQNELKKVNVALMKIDEALHIVQREMRRSNDLIVIDSIKFCPIDLTTQGSFLLKEEFKILKPMEVDAVVFLFEDIIVFALNHSTPTKFPYLGHIEMKNLMFDSMKKGKFLQISNFVKTKQGDGDRNTYVMEAKTEKIKENWVEILEKVLWSQFNQAKEKQRHSAQEKTRRFSEVVYRYIRKSRPLVISTHIFETKEEF